jgi:hypothetical protein
MHRKKGKGLVLRGCYGLQEFFPACQNPAWEKSAPGAGHGRPVVADVGPRGPSGGGRTEGPTLRREPAVGPVGEQAPAIADYGSG